MRNIYLQQVSQFIPRKNGFKFLFIYYLVNIKALHIVITKVCFFIIIIIIGHNFSVVSIRHVVLFTYYRRQFTTDLIHQNYYKWNTSALLHFKLGMPKLTILKELCKDLLGYLGFRYLKSNQLSINLYAVGILFNHRYN